MARRKKTRTNYKVALDFDRLVSLAPRIILPGMKGMIDGLQLQPSSGLWRKLDGTMTARLVYRDPGLDRASLVLSVRNISPDLVRGLMSDGLPLFNWQKQAEHYRLQSDREQLLGRIAKLRPHAHKRLALEERVRQITLRQMAIENELYAKGSHP